MKLPKPFVVVAVLTSNPADFEAYLERRSEHVWTAVWSLSYAADGRLRPRPKPAPEPGPFNGPRLVEG